MFKRWRRGEDGSVAITATATLVLLSTIVMLVLRSGHAATTKRELQSAADEGLSVVRSSPFRLRHGAGVHPRAPGVGDLQPHRPGPGIGVKQQRLDPGVGGLGHVGIHHPGAHQARALGVVEQRRPQRLTLGQRAAVPGGGAHRRPLARSGRIVWEPWPCRTATSRGCSRSSTRRSTT